MCMIVLEKTKMQENDTIRLSANRTLLVKDLQVEHLLDYLVSDSIIDDELEAHISAKTTRQDRVRELLRILPSRGRVAYSVFRAALCETGQEHLVEALDNTDIEDVRRRRLEARLLETCTMEPIGASRGYQPLQTYTTGASSLTATLPGLFNYRTQATATPTGPFNHMTQSTAQQGGPIYHQSQIATQKGVNNNFQAPATREISFLIYSPDMPPSTINYTAKREICTQIIPVSSAPSDCSLRYPTGVTYCSTSKTLLVADYENSRIMRYDLDGSNGRRFVNSDVAGGKFRPWDIAISQSGRVFVTDDNNQRVLVFSRDGEYLKSFGPGGPGLSQFGLLRGITCHNGCVLVCDWRNRRVIKFTEDGGFIDYFVTGQPMFVAVGPGDNIYVTNYERTDDGGNTGTGKVCVYSWHGRPGRVFGGRSGVNSSISGLTVDNEGYVCVAWPIQNQVVVYGPEGGYRAEFGKQGWGDGELAWPQGLELLPDSRVVVCDSSNNRLQIF